MNEKQNRLTDVKTNVITIEERKGEKDKLGVWE